MANKNEKKNKAHKTNAVRMVETEGIEYGVYEYDAPDGFLDGISVASALGQDLKQVFKTLVAVGVSRQYYVCVIPVAEKLDLKKAAKHFGEKKIEMLPSRQITYVTGYIKGGCSPIGMKKPLPTAVDCSAQHLDTIMVSAGKVGLQMELPVNDLLRITDAQLAELTAGQE